MAITVGDDQPQHALQAPTQALLRGFERPPAVAPIPAKGPLPGSADLAQSRQGFRVGSLALLMPYAQGSELTDMPLVHRLPNSPDWLLGMANLQGKLVPVFDLARRFGLARQEATRPMLLVLGHGADAAGVVIDGVPSRLRFSADAPGGPDTVPEALRAVVHGSTLIDGQLWFDLDVPALLAALEKSLGEFR